MKVLLPLLMVIGSVCAFATTATTVSPCGTASLDTYESSYNFPASSGCAIGVLDYSNFTYHALSNAPATSDIILTPSASDQGFGFTHAGGSPFTANAGQIVQFEIDFNILIDPAPVIHGSTVRIDPPTGDVTVTENFCNDSIYFFPGTCFGGPVDKLSVGTPVTGYPYSASITFENPAMSFETVGILFTLDGTNGASSFDGVDTGTQLTLSPEPASILLVGIFLLGGLAVKKKLHS